MEPQVSEDSNTRPLTWYTETSPSELALAGIS